MKISQYKHYGVLLLLSGSYASIQNTTIFPKNLDPETSCLQPDGICDTTENNLHCSFNRGDCLGDDINMEDDFPKCLQALESQNPSLSDNWNRHTENIGNGKCDAGRFNIEECGFEFGECIDFNEEYPRCNDPGAASSLGDGVCNWSYNNSECRYDGGDCRSLSVRLGIVLINIFLLSVVCIIVRRDRTIGGGDRTGPEDVYYPRPFQSAEDKEAEEFRRDFIMSRIIHKKVLSASSCQTQQGADDLILPHGHVMSKRSGLQLIFAKITQTSNNAKVASATTSTNKDGEISIHKEDVYVEHPPHCTQYSSSDEESERRRPVTPDTVEELHEIKNNHMYSPRVCPICMESYTDGDDIAWSYNEACTHVFHRECIVRWLIKNDDCPMCRSPYIVNTYVSCDDAITSDDNPAAIHDTVTDPDSRV